MLSWSRKRLKRGSKRRTEKSASDRVTDDDVIVVGSPQGLKHRTHMARDKHHSWGISGLPLQWKQMLEAHGITKQQFQQGQKNILQAVTFFQGGHRNEKIPLETTRALEARMEKISDMIEEDPYQYYEKIKQIGKGASGTVFKSRKIKTGEMQAVKVSKIEEYEFIKSEIAYHALSNHKNIVNYHETYVFGSEVFIVMDFIDGGSLTDLLPPTNPNSWTEPFISFVMHECLEALDFMHGQNLLHRDIKSDNVLVARDGGVKLGDFGFAIGLTREKERRKSIVGTPFWMAPEVVNGEDYDQRCDIWSLGITTIELIDEQPPYMDMNHVKALVEIIANPSPMPKKKNMYTKELLRFLELSLKKDQRQRPNARELLELKFFDRKVTQEQFSEFVEAALDAKEEADQGVVEFEDDEEVENVLGERKSFYFS